LGNHFLFVLLFAWETLLPDWALSGDRADSGHRVSSLTVKQFKAKEVPAGGISFGVNGMEQRASGSRSSLDSGRSQPKAPVYQNPRGDIRSRPDNATYD
jgi:hypothetical protein